MRRTWPDADADSSALTTEDTGHHHTDHGGAAGHMWDKGTKWTDRREGITRWDTGRQRRHV